MQNILFIGRWENTEKIAENIRYPDMKFYYADSIKELRALEKKISDFHLTVQLNVRNAQLIKAARRIGKYMDKAGTDGLSKLCKDKFSTYRIAKECGVAVPATRVFRSADKLDKIIEEFDSKRVFIKPRRSSGSKGANYYFVSDIKQAKSRKEIKKLLGEFKDMLVCEYVPTIRRSYERGKLKLEARLFFAPITRNGRYKGALYVSGLLIPYWDFPDARNYGPAMKHIDNAFRNEIRNKKFLETIQQNGEDIINAIYSKVDSEFAGPRVFALDFLIRKKTLQPYFLEINSSPQIVSWGNYKTDGKIIKDFKNRFIPEVVACAKYLK